MNTALRGEFQFQLKHGMFSTTPGQAICALKHARAYLTLQEAIDKEIAEVIWEYDDDHDPDLWDDPLTREDLKNGTLEILGCILTIRGEHAESLWGIVIGFNDPYSHVIEAELALECLEKLQQALNDRLIDLEWA
jgi:uncharacterized protein YjbK